MNKALLVFCLAVCFVFSSCSGEGGENILPVTEKSFSSLDVSDKSEWFPVDKDTLISISDVKDDELFVISAVPVSSSSARTVVGKALSLGGRAGGLNRSQTGKTLIRTNDGKAEFTGSNLGVSNTPQMARIERLPVKKIDGVAQFNDMEIGVFDYNGKGNGKVFIPGSQCGGYYIDEKVLNVDVDRIRQELIESGINPDVFLKRCVITRKFIYRTSSMVEDPNYTGVHNTRDSYGFLLKENGNYVVKNEGVFDFSQMKGKVSLYAGFASNVIMGSGMELKISCLRVLEPSKKTSIDDGDAAFGLENLDGEYVLKISSLGENKISAFTLCNTSTELRKYDGQMLPRGFMASYEDSDSDYYYYIGKVSGDVYIDNHSRDNVQKNSTGHYYDIELLNAEDSCVKDKIKFADARKKVVFEVGIEGESTFEISDDTILYRRIGTEQSSRTGSLSFLMSNAGQKLNYRVSFEKWDWPTKKWTARKYDDSSLRCIINYASTGNKLLENSVNTANGQCPIEFIYMNINEPVRAVVEFF